MNILLIIALLATPVDDRRGGWSGGEVPGNLLQLDDVYIQGTGDAGDLQIGNDGSFTKSIVLDTGTTNGDLYILQSDGITRADVFASYIAGFTLDSLGNITAGSDGTGYFQAGAASTGVYMQSTGTKGQLQLGDDAAFTNSATIDVSGGNFAVDSNLSVGSSSIQTGGIISAGTSVKARYTMVVGGDWYYGFSDNADGRLGTPDVTLHRAGTGQLKLCDGASCTNSATLTPSGDGNLILSNAAGTQGVLFDTATADGYLVLRSEISGNLVLTAQNLQAYASVKTGTFENFTPITSTYFGAASTATAANTGSTELRSTASTNTGDYASGNVNIYSGDTTTDGDTGDIQIYTGVAGAGVADSGDIKMSVNGAPGVGTDVALFTDSAATFYNPILAPNGNAAAPSYSFSTDSGNTGFWLGGSSSPYYIGASVAGVNVTEFGRFNTTFYQLVKVDSSSADSDGYIGFRDATGGGGTADTCITRDGAAAKFDFGNCGAVAVSVDTSGGDWDVDAGIRGTTIVSEGQVTAVNAMRAGGPYVTGSQSTDGFLFSDNADGRLSSADTALVRASAAVVKITNGSTGGGTIQLGDPGTRPTCDSAARGMFWVDEGGTGVADSVAVCAKDSGDAYAWRTIY